MRWPFSTALRWVTTMTTNIEGLPSEAAGKAIEGAGEDARGFDPASGLPSVEVLTRLANDMFARLPGGGFHPGGAPVIIPEAAAASPAPATALPRGPLPADPLKPVDVPLAGAPGVNSNFAPSAHGAPLSRPLPPSPIAVPLSGEADLRALLKQRIPSPASPLPGQELAAKPEASPAYPQGQARTPVPTDPLKPVDVPFAGAPGVASNFAPSAHGAPLFRPLPPSPIAVPLPGEAELRALLSERIPSLAAAPGYPAQGRAAPPQPASLSHGATVGSPGSSYYFLDESRHPRATKAASQPLEPQPGYDVLAVRRDFPILDQRINGHPLVWLDNAATTQKPQCRDRSPRRITTSTRTPTFIAQRIRWRRARPTPTKAPARKCGASSTPRPRTRSCSCAARPKPSTSSRKAGAARTSARATRSSSPGWSTTPTSCRGSSSAPRPAPCCASRPSTTAARSSSTSTRICSTPRTKLVSFTQVSNALGTVTPAREMVEMAHRHGALVLVDGAQAVSHMRVDVQELDCRLLRASRATRCSRRRALAFSTESANCSTACRHGRAAAT